MCVCMISFNVPLRKNLLRIYDDGMGIERQNKIFFLNFTALTFSVWHQGGEVNYTTLQTAKIKEVNSKNVFEFDSIIANDTRN